MRKMFKMNEVLFIEETQEWVINGKIVKDSELTLEQKMSFYSLKENYEIINSVKKPSIHNLIL